MSMRYKGAMLSTIAPDKQVLMDVYKSNVTLLLNGSGANGSTTFTDLSDNPISITPYGNAQVSTSIKKYGTGSIYLDASGVGAYIGTSNLSSLAFGNGDFTVEMWFNKTNSTNTFFEVLFDCRASDNTSEGFAMGTSSAGEFVSYGLGGGRIVEFSGNMPLNTWHHLAVSRVAGVCYIFLNGVLQVTKTLSNNYTQFKYTCGADQGRGTGYLFYGYIDDIRITKGIGRYVSNFTPPLELGILRPTANSGIWTIRQRLQIPVIVPPATIEALIVAGGGGGGDIVNGGRGAGGGAGGLLYYGAETPKTPNSSALNITAGSTIAVTVGAGGAICSSLSTGDGGISSLGSTYTAVGGGGGSYNDGVVGHVGGCGGGGWYTGVGGAGTSGQGYGGGNGQTSPRYGGGGGGGTGVAGTTGTTVAGGNGGNGLAYVISGASTYYGGGGSGDVWAGTGSPSAAGTAGLGGGGTGNNFTGGTSGTANTGGGGGAGSGLGGSGVVIIRYPDSYSAASATTGSPTITVAGGYRVYKFTSSGSITF